MLFSPFYGLQCAKIHNVQTEPLHLRIKPFLVLLVTISASPPYSSTPVFIRHGCLPKPRIGLLMGPLYKDVTSTGYTISMTNNLKMLYGDLLSLTRVPLNLSNFRFLNRPGTAIHGSLMEGWIRETSADDTHLYKIQC